VNRVAPQTLSASLERCWSLIYDSNSSNVQRSMAKNLLYGTPPHSRRAVRARCVLTQTFSLLAAQIFRLGRGCRTVSRG
jgi:hypothetical protein